MSLDVFIDPQNLNFKGGWFTVGTSSFLDYMNRLNEEKVEWRISDSIPVPVPEIISVQQLQALSDSIEESGLLEKELSAVYFLFDSIDECIEKLPNTIIINANSDEEFGEYIVDLNGLSREQLLQYFDYESYGRDMRINGNYIQTDVGFVRKT
ncbi:Antirestriction protein (ArdA) [Pilibacter termitis]|uniref:Antirestriction protein (ArdA) n=1 Tax=Pilibacter termitis TaxID=263852 RepID=A0A1T4NEX3_9ENTE|nr:antirestriction protein ArdA [Pilibacter termitis]SJZ77557.1 Antirestriction protein (ArdA) [Pilibacter termitis]